MAYISIFLVASTKIGYDTVLGPPCDWSCTGKRLDDLHKQFAINPLQLDNANTKKWHRKAYMFNPFFQPQGQHMFKTCNPLGIATIIIIKYSNIVIILPLAQSTVHRVKYVQPVLCSYHIFLYYQSTITSGDSLIEAFHCTVAILSPPTHTHTPQYPPIPVAILDDMGKILRCITSTAWPRRMNLDIYFSIEGMHFNGIN